MIFVQPSRSVRRQPQTLAASSASSGWMTWCSPPTLCASRRHSDAGAVSFEFSQRSAATSGSRRTV